MIWFLRLFPAYQRLEAQSRADTAEIERLKSSLMAALDKSDSARAETIQVMREQADFIAFQTTRRTIHGTKIQEQQPDAPTPEPTPARGVQGRAIVQKGYEQFIKDSIAEFNQDLQDRTN